MCLEAGKQHAFQLVVRLCGCTARECICLHAVCPPYSSRRHYTPASGGCRGLFSTPWYPAAAAAGYKLHGQLDVVVQSVFNNMSAAGARRWRGQWQYSTKAKSVEMEWKGAGVLIKIFGSLMAIHAPLRENSHTPAHNKTCPQQLPINCTPSIVSMAAALWATSLRRCRSLGKTTSCLPAAFAAFTAYATPQMSPWLMYDNDQRRSCSTAVAPQEIPVHDRYPEETKPPALSRLIPNLVDYEDLKKHDGRCGRDYIVVGIVALNVPPSLSTHTCSASAAGRHP